MNNHSELTITEPPDSRDGWLIEKASGVVESLAFQVETVRRDAMLTDESREEILASVSESLWDATKVISRLCGVSWSTNDRDLILDHGHDGYQRLAVSYGILSITDKDRARQEQAQALSEFCTEMSPLLRGAASPNRTLVHELLGRTSVEHESITRIRDLIESVSQGEMSWSQFQPRANGLLQKLANKTAPTSAPQC